MQAMIIAVIINNKQIEKYRLLRIPEDKKYDSRSIFEVIDVTEYQLKYVMKTNGIEILNAKIKDDKIAGYGAQLTRYTKIDSSTNKQLGKAPLVILRQVKNNDATIGYVVSDFKGKVVNGNIDDIIKYTKINGIANGKLVIKDNKEFISPIIDNYDILEIGNNKQKEIKAWTIEEFREYMNKNNYRFSLINTTLNYVDDRIRDLVIPNGVTVIQQLKETVDTSDLKYSLMQNLVLPNTLWFSSSYAFDNMPFLKTITFESGTKSINFEAIQHTNCANTVEIIIPEDVETIISHNYKMKRQGLDADYSKYKHLERLYQCCVKSEISGKLDLGCTKELDDSLIAVKGYTGTIKIPKEAVKIKGSIQSLDVSGIDFSEAVNLITIGDNSFNNLSNIKQLDLSSCTSLIEIKDNCFNNCPMLEEVILPDSITDIGKNCFSNCIKLCKINLPTSLKSVEDGFIEKTDIKELIIPPKLMDFNLSNRAVKVIVEPRTKIPYRLFFNVSCQEAIIPDCVEEFGYESFAFTDTKFNMPKSLKIIGKRAFESFQKVGLFDLSNCTNLVTIEDQAFEHSWISGLILPDGLVKLGDKALKNIAKLTWLYMPSSISEIGLRCLQASGTDSPLGLTVYTYKGCYADSYCKKNKIRIVYVESLDEAIEKIEESNPELSSKKLSKLRLILSGDPLNSVLLTDTYINRATELYKIYSCCNEDYTFEKDISLIDKDLVNVGIQSFLKQKELSVVTSTELYCTNKNVFNAYVNYLTTFSTNHSQILNKKCFDYLYDNNIFLKDEAIVLLNCGDRKVTLFKLSIHKKLLFMIIVSIGDTAVYCTVFNAKTGNKIIEPLPKIPETNRIPLELVLKPNTAYPISSSMKLNIPSYISKAIMDLARQQFILIGLNVIKANQFATCEGLAKVYLYSAVSGNIIETEARIFINDNMDLSWPSIYTIGIKNIYSIHDIPKDVYNDIRTSYFSQDNISLLIPKMMLGDDYLNKLKNLPGAYDEPEACIEWEFSKALQDSGITDISQLNHKVLGIFLDFPFFYKTRKRLEELDKLSISSNITIDNKYSLISFHYSQKRKNTIYKLIGHTPRYITILKDNTKEYTGTVQCYVSNGPVDAIFDILRKLKNDNGEAEYYINNNKIDLKEYYLLPPYGNNTSLYTNGVSYTLRLYIGINRKTGIIFLLAGYKNRANETISYKVFRYRNLEEAIESCKWIYTDHLDLDNGSINSLQGEMEKLLEHIEYSKNFDYSAVIKVRDLIIDGYPNGYALADLSKYLFDSAAKQRKMT